MPRERPISTQGVILRREPAGHYGARLLNGHEVVAFPARRAVLPGGEIPAGTVVVLELTPFDFSRAAIRSIAGSPSVESGA